MKQSLGRSLRAVLPPVILGGLVIFLLREPITWWLHGEEIYDQEAIQEWIREARNTKTLPELTREYVELIEQQQAYRQRIQGDIDERAFNISLHLARTETANKREEIEEFLKSIGNPPTKMYKDQLPLFPLIYRITVTFDDKLDAPPIVWDSELPRQKSQYRVLPQQAIHPLAEVSVQYHLHAYQQRQLKERLEAQRRLWLSGLAILFALLALFWIFLNQRRERQREHQRLLARQQLSEAERLRLQEELRRQEAERKHEEAERQNLELKSQLFANIGIMAGSYAHNIKNLLVRPNDLLRRCMEDASDGRQRQDMLREVKDTLGTVTQRLQQILQTVRRDPSKAEKIRIDLNALLRDMQRTWADLAREKWKLQLEADLPERTPLWIEGDLSHLQQALENLLFNARDATFEMRNHLREAARRTAAGAAAPARTSSPAEPAGSDAALTETRDSERRQALIAAAAWKGHVILAARRRGDEAIVEVRDNGIGMTEEVRRRCTETHFSTKRDNALFAGLSAGMGLGLSFVQVVLQHHGARLHVESEPLRGSTFRIHFPLTGAGASAPA